MKITKFEDIEAWRSARELTKQIYEITAQEDFAKDYGLRDQIQRAAVSIMANIVEGFDSQTNQTFIQFLGYALRSSSEVQSHLYVALDRSYISQETFEQLYQQVVSVKRLIGGFIRYLRSHPTSKSKI